MIMNLLDRMKLPFRKNKEFVTVLYDILGFYPHNIEIYRVAFSHKSLTYGNGLKNTKERKAGQRDKKQRNEGPTRPLNNERLEYLGDAVLEAVVSDLLFRHFPFKREGFLTSTRSKIVQREALNRLAEQMGIDTLIHAAQGTRMSHTNIGGNAFEALMGAIYLDRGFKYSQWFIEHRVIGPYVDIDKVAHKEVNFKSKLLEWCQKNRIETKFRDSLDTEGDRGFHSCIVLEGITVGKGTGRTKKESQQVASKDALNHMRREPKFYDSIFRAKEKRTAMEADESFALPKIDESEGLILSPKATEMPVLEEADGQRINKPKSKADFRTTSDAAYDEAYGESSNFEVIDGPENESEYSEYATSIQPDEEENVETTAEGNSEGESEPQEKVNQEVRTPQTKANRKRERNRAAKTMDDAVNGGKKKKANVPEKVAETAPSEETPQAGDTEAKPLSESAKRRQRRKARRESMPVDEENPFVDLDKELEERAEETVQPVAEEAKAEDNDTSAAEDNFEAKVEDPETLRLVSTLISNLQQNQAAEETASNEADEPLETVELHVAPEVGEDTGKGTVAPLVLEEYVETSTEEEPIDEADEANLPENESSDIVEEAPSEVAETGLTAPETPEAEEEAVPVETETEHAETSTEEEASEDTDNVSDNSEEENEEETGENLNSELSADNNLEEDEESEAQPATSNALDEDAARPMLRHISLDDFVFGATDAVPSDIDAPSAEDASEEGLQRSRRSRRRKPARKQGSEDAANKETQKAEQQKSAKPKSSEAKKGKQQPKKPSADAEADEKLRAEREKAAKRRAQQRRRRRRERNNGEEPFAED